MKYRSKPHYINAWQWNGEAYCTCPDWVNKLIESGLVLPITENNKEELKLEVGLYLKHKMKYTKVYPFDYIYIRGDTVHHSSSDTFEENYEPVPNEYVEPEVTKEEISTWRCAPGWEPENVDSEREHELWADCEGRPFPQDQWEPEE